MASRKDASKRSKAARRGWETRRANQAAARRSEAARRGWETRRERERAAEREQQAEARRPLRYSERDGRIRDARGRILSHEAVRAREAAGAPILLRGAPVDGRLLGLTDVGPPLTQVAQRRQAAFDRQGWAWRVTTYEVRGDIALSPARLTALLRSFPDGALVQASLLVQAADGRTWHAAKGALMPRSADARGAPDFAESWPKIAEENARRTGGRPEGLGPVAPTSELDNRTPIRYFVRVTVWEQVVSAASDGSISKRSPSAGDKPRTAPRRGGRKR